MSEQKQYQGIVGWVFKDPEHKTTQNQKGLRRLVVSEANSRNSFYSVTVWDEAHGDIAIAKGDLVAAQGKYDETTKEGQTFKNISARYFVALGNGVGHDSGPPAQRSPEPDAEELPY